MTEGYERLGCRCCGADLHPEDKSICPVCREDGAEFPVDEDEGVE